MHNTNTHTHTFTEISGKEIDEEKGRTLINKESEMKSAIVRVYRQQEKSDKTEWQKVNVCSHNGYGYDNDDDGDVFAKPRVVETPLSFSCATETHVTCHLMQTYALAV